MNLKHLVTTSLFIVGMNSICSKADAQQSHHHKHTHYKSVHSKNDPKQVKYDDNAWYVPGNMTHAEEMAPNYFVYPVAELASEDNLHTVQDSAYQDSNEGQRARINLLNFTKTLHLEKSDTSVDKNGKQSLKQVFSGPLGFDTVTIVRGNEKDQPGKPAFQDFKNIIMTKSRHNVSIDLMQVVEKENAFLEKHIKGDNLYVYHDQSTMHGQQERLHAGTEVLCNELILMSMDPERYHTNHELEISKPGGVHYNFSKMK